MVNVIALRPHDVRIAQAADVLRRIVVEVVRPDQVDEAVAGLSSVLDAETFRDRLDDLPPCAAAMAGAWRVGVLAALNDGDDERRGVRLVAALKDATTVAVGDDDGSLLAVLVSALNAPDAAGGEVVASRLESLPSPL